MKSSLRCIPYIKVLKILNDRLNATQEEIAAWIFMGEKDGGLAAYTNADELDPAPRFYFSQDKLDEDYISPLMACWFLEKDIVNFQPADRFITGKVLTERWNESTGGQAKAFIIEAIKQSKLLDLHPTFGGVYEDSPEGNSLPPLESGLFLLAQVEVIEGIYFDPGGTSDVTTRSKEAEMGSPERRSQIGRNAANARYDQPGGSRDKQRQIRELWATGNYSSRNICAEKEYAELGIAYRTARNALVNTPDP